MKKSLSPLLKLIQLLLLVTIKLLGTKIKITYFNQIQPRLYTKNVTQKVIISQNIFNSKMTIQKIMISPNNPYISN